MFPFFLPPSLPIVRQSYIPSYVLNLLSRRPVKPATIPYEHCTIPTEVYRKSLVPSLLHSVEESCLNKSVSEEVNSYHQCCGPLKSGATSRVSAFLSFPDTPWEQDLKSQL